MVSLTTCLVAAASLAGAANGQLDVDFIGKQFTQTAKDGLNTLRQFGGLGPYVDRQPWGLSREPPLGCQVDQVFLVMRHGERYPDPSTAQSMLTSLNKLTKSGITTFNGSLSFLNTWDNFLDEPGLYGQETFTGPYSGLSDALSRGAEYRARYGHLWDQQSHVPIFASGYNRVLNSARKFGEGFFGYNYSTVAQVQVIPEDSGQGANSLTPTCYAKSNSSIPNISINNFPQFANAANRLNAENKGLSLSSGDIQNLMMFAAFELNARPYSPWVNVFTSDEWIAGRYLMDLIYYYNNGPGNSNSAAIGSVYLNATYQLMQQGPDKVGSLYFSFVHDSNILPIVTALNISMPEKDLPVDRVEFGTKFVSSELVPMGGHLTLERLSCNNNNSSYVRAIINEAVVPWNDCQSGPGFSCPLQQYSQKIQALPNYVQACKVPQGYPQQTTFFTNYNQSTALNYPSNGSIAYQLGEITWNGLPAKL